MPGCPTPAEGSFCHRHWKQVQRAGQPAELAYAKMMSLVYELGAIATEPDSDRDFERIKAQFDRAFIEAARHHHSVLSKLTRRMRRR